MKESHLFHSFCLFLAALVWGTTFVAQSIGAEHVGAFTFLAARSWIGVLCLLPVIAFMERHRPRHFPKREGSSRGMLLRAGLICGFFLFTASAAQQIGIADTTPAKSGFITSMYVVLVPVLTLFLGRRIPLSLWLCVALGCAGLYYLCFPARGDGLLASLGRGDALTLLCALLFSCQIIAVDRYAPHTDPIKLSAVQFLATAVFSTVCAAAWESLSLRDLQDALPSILYAGVLSSGVGFTLQIIGQMGTTPAVASLLMSLESVFSAVGGWLVLGQFFSGREFFGASLMFAAVLLSQLPHGTGKAGKKRKASAPDPL